MKLRVKVTGHQKLGRLARRLRAAADGGLAADVKTELVRTGPPVLARVRAVVLSASFPAQTPSSEPSGRSTGLRARLAAATTTQELSAPPGVRFTVQGSVVLPENARGGHKLAMYSDGELARRWRHQVFGRTANPQDWFVQLGQPWFFAPIRTEESRFAAGVERACDKTARRIEGAR